MATDTETSSADAAAPSRAKATGTHFIEFDTYIDRQLKRTRRQVKGVDFSSALIALAAGSLGFFLLVALVDHWVVAGGLGTWGRVLALVVYLCGAAAFVVHSMLPLLIKRINPVYAAHAIERTRPGLKNSLVNFLLLRSSQSTPATVFAAIEEQAATQLSHMPADSAVDRSHMIRLGYVLLAVVAVFAVYKVASPKDPFASMQRIMAPWANIPAPTRVLISDVKPGSARAFHEQTVTVTAAVVGLGASDDVTLFFTTADGQTVEQPIAMQESDSGLYTTMLPPGGVGMQQDAEYRIKAGDAITQPFHLRVVIPPAIVVESINYQYPAYTELPPRRVERQGDLKELEGTQVTITARANQPIKSAHVDFDGNGTRDLAMGVSESTASATFELKLTRDSQGRSTDKPEHDRYQILFTNRDGHENLVPSQHVIQVVRDKSPSVQMNKPPLDEREQPLALGGIRRFVVEAADPDFKLGKVELIFEKGGQPLPVPPLLSEPRAGKFTRDYLFDSGKFDLKQGDSVTVYAAVEDNKAPNPNRVLTDKYTFRIGDPATDQQRQQQMDQAQKEAQQDQQQQQDKQQPKPGEGEKQDQPKQPKEGDPQEPESDGDPQSGEGGQQGKSKPSEQNPDAEQDPNQQPEQDRGGEAGGQPGKNRPPERIDPEREPDKAFDQINQHREQQEQQAGEQPKSDQQKKQAGEQPQQRPGQQSEEQQGSDNADQQPSDGADNKRSATDNEDMPKDDQQQPSSDGDSPRKPQPGESADKDRSNEDKSAEEQGTKNKTGEEQPPSPANDKDQAGKQPKDRQPKDGQSNDKQPKEKQRNEKQPGDGEDAQRPQPMPGDQAKKGDNDQGDKNATEKQSDKQDKQVDKGAGKDPAADKPAQEQQPGKPGEQPRPGEQPKANNNQEPMNQPDKEQPGKEQGNKDQPGKEQGDQEQSGKEQPGKEQPGKEQPGKEQPGKEQAGKEQAGKEQAGKEQAGKEQAGSEQAGKEQGAKPDGKQGKQQGTPPQGAKPSGDKPDEKESGGGDIGDQPGKPTGDPEKMDQPPGDADKPQTGDKLPMNQALRDPKAGTPKPGDGDATQGTTKPDQEKPGDQPDQKKDSADNPMGGDPKNQKGESGAGEASKDNAGAATRERAVKPTDKTKKPSPGKSPNAEDDASPQTDKASRESDSEGGESGEDPGGGKKGPGQSAKQPGTGGAGKNTASDDGAGESDQSGEGPTAERGGNKKEASKPTGSAGKEKGEGSKSRAGNDQTGGDKSPMNQDPAAGDDAPKDANTQEKPAPGGKQPKPPMNQAQKDQPAGDKPDADQPKGEPSDGQANPSDGAPKSGDQPGQKAGEGKPQLNGNPETGGPPEQDPEMIKQDGSQEPGGEAANLEYKRKATDLALEHLKDQLAKDKPDQELLDKTGWTREDMQRFVDKWEAMKRDAKQPGARGEAARQELDQALRELKLKPRGTSLDAGQGKDDRTRKMRDARRSTPPPEYQDLYRTFTKERE